MALPSKRTTELSLKQRVAVAHGRFIPKTSRAELMVSALKEAPAGLSGGTTAFEMDSLGGVQKFYTQDRGRWYEVFLFGPIPNQRRRDIAGFFGFDEKQNIQVTAVEHIGPYEVL
jgi:hypothetical protein